MKSNEKITLPDIGEVEFKRSKRAKHISLRIDAAGNVRVSLPHRGSMKRAVEAVYARQEWLQKHLGKINARKNHFNRSLSNSGRNISREEAKDVLLPRLAELAARHKFSYNRATVRSQKTRWGSCSGRDNISLNMKLIGLPSHLIDYVLLHELAHTREKNHSPAFWSQMEHLVGDYRALRSELKQYPIELL